MPTRDDVHVVSETRTAWDAVERQLATARERIAAAINPEDFQAVALTCRETLISLAQAVYDPAVHGQIDGVQPSESDARRRLEAFLERELPGSSNEEARRLGKSAVALAVAVQHQRTAGFREASLCIEGCLAIVNIVSLLVGRRPEDRPAETREPFRFPRMGELELDAIVEFYRAHGEEPALPRMEERDVMLARGFSVAHYPGTQREVWVGFVDGRYEHLLMLKAKT